MEKIVYPSDAILTPDKLSFEKPSDEKMDLMGFENPASVENLGFIIKDILQGDMSLAKDERYSYMNFNQLKTALEWLMHTEQGQTLQQELTLNPWRLNFKAKPPTAEEFLSHKYIGAMADSVWPLVKKRFIDFWDPLKPYRVAALNPSIGAGKSTFTMLSLLLNACHYGLMRSPHKFFTMAETSVFVFVLCAVTQSKGNEIYREPIQQLIESSTFWHWCKTHQDMIREEKHLQELDDVDYLPWTMATASSAFQTGNGLNWKVISDAGSLLGMNILMGAMTEITFFLDSGKGWTEEKIYEFFTKLKQRITNRFQSNYYARFILDSSPSTLADPIQNWMTNDAPLNEENFIWKGARWDLFPEEFPEAISVKDRFKYTEEIIRNYNWDNSFKLFLGGDGKPPAVCEDEGQASAFKEQDMIWCPKKQVTKKGISNFLNRAKENPLEFMKDFAGRPAGQPDRLFYKGEWVEDCFDNNLKNVYGGIIAHAEDEPEHLIWDQIEHEFFYTVMGRKYFYYEHNLPRVLSVDQSKARDCTCIAMSHVELDPERIDPHTGRNLVVYVTDFTIVLIPKGGHINLDAIKWFIVDLRDLGGVNLRHVAFDGFQSDPTRQFLMRKGFTVDYVSVDSDNEPYYKYYDLVTHNRWFCGKNIFTKNNMLALHETRRRSGSVKIDHFEGELNYDFNNGDWKSCTAGRNAKDTTDAIASNLALLDKFSNEFIATHLWYPHDNIGRSLEAVKENTNQWLGKNKMFFM